MRTTSYRIISDKGYPDAEDILFSLDFYYGSPNHGKVLIVGRDGQGREYMSVGDDGAYGEGKYPAIAFSFKLEGGFRYPDILEKEYDDAFFDSYVLRLWREADAEEPPLDLEPDVALEFKKIAVWGAVELAESSDAGKVANHFWGEMYIERPPVLERFLEAYVRTSQTPDPLEVDN